MVVGTGAFVGALASLGVWREAQVAIAAGANPFGIGFGVTHLLFVASLPWSIPVLLVMWVVGLLLWLVTSLTGTEVPAVLAQLLGQGFYLMPVAAGAGWAWAASVLLARLIRHRAPQAPAA